MIDDVHSRNTGGGQKLCISRVVLPVADNIFKLKFFASVLLVQA